MLKNIVELQMLRKKKHIISNLMHILLKYFSFNIFNENDLKNLIDAT